MDEFQMHYSKWKKHTQKVIKYMIPFIWYSGKGKTVGNEVFATGEGEGEVWVQRKSELSLFFLISSFFILGDCQPNGSQEKASGLKEVQQTWLSEITMLFLQVNKSLEDSRQEGQCFSRMKPFLGS